MQAFEPEEGVPAAGRHSGMVGAVVFVAWLGSVASVTWGVLDPIKDRLVEAYLASERTLTVASALRLAVENTTPVQAGMLLLAIALTLAVLLLEVRRRALTIVLLESRWPLLLTYAAVALWFGHSYIGRGHLLSGDTAAHLSMVATRVGAILAGEDPYWSNFKRLGLPLEAFYSPTTFWPLTWLALWTGPTVALRTFLFLAHALSGLAFFAMGRQFGLGRLAAVFGGMVYVGAFAHLHVLLFRGNVPLALSLVLLPLAFMLLHRLLVARVVSAGAWVALALMVGGLLANYPPFAIIAGIYLALFSIGMIAAGAAPWTRLLPLAGAAAVAGGLAAFVLVPAALAGSEIKPLALADLVFLAWPSWAYLDHLVMWRAWRTDMVGATAYLGVTAIAFAAVGAAVAWRSHELPRATACALRLATCGLLLSLFLRGAHVRDIGFTLLFLAVLAGVGAAWLAHRLASWRHAPAAILLLLFMDLGSTAIQPIGRSDKGFIERAATYLTAQSPPSRVMEGAIHNGRYRYDSGAGILTWYPVESVGGGHVEMATPAWIHGDLAGLLVEADLRMTGRLRPSTREVLCLLRVGRIIATGPRAMGLPASVVGAEDEGPLGRVLRPGCRYQAVFAPQLELAAFPPVDARVDYGEARLRARLPQFEAFVEHLTSGMAIDDRTGVARRILVADAALIGAAPSGSEPAPRLEELGYHVTSSRIEVELQTTAAGFVRLSHAWHRRLRVLRNGQPIEAFPDITHAIVVPVEAGRTRIEIAPAADPALRLGSVLSAATAGGLIVLLLLPLARRRLAARS